MAYTNRDAVEARIPEEVSRAMLGKAVEQSAVLQLFRSIPVARNQVRFPILSALPVAYWVDGEAQPQTAGTLDGVGLKQTTQMGWANKMLNVEEMATILPVPENVFDDMEANLWDEAEPYIREAFARLLDQTVFLGGTAAPSSFPGAVVPSAIAAGNVKVERALADANYAATGGYMGDLDELQGMVEADGFNITGFLADLSVKRELRASRNAQGDRLDAGRVGGDLGSIDGVPVAYPMSGLWPATGTAGQIPRIIAGDWANQFVVGVRQDITFKLLDQAVIQNNDGSIMFNLAQQDMVAVRVRFRVGWQVANTINNQNPNAATRYPAAVLARRPVGV